MQEQTSRQEGVIKISLFLNQNMCCVYSKEPSQWDGSLEHTNQMLKLVD